MVPMCSKKYFILTKWFQVCLIHVYSHVILQIDGCEQLATESTILQNSLNLFLLGWKCQIMFQLGLSTWKGNLILVILPLFATIFEESHKKSHEKIFKHLGQHEILLGTHCTPQPNVHWDKKCIYSDIFQRKCVKTFVHLRNTMLFD